VVIGPFIKGATSQFGAVVHDQNVGVASVLNQEDETEVRGSVTNIGETAFAAGTALEYGLYLSTDEAFDAADRGGSVRLNSFEPLLKWVSRSVMPPPGLVTTG